MAATSISLPELTRLQFAAAKLDLSAQKNIVSLQSGAYTSVIRGRGIDFAETRAYQAGDDIRHIDWRITARTNEPHTKIFNEEKERPVYFLVDYGDSMHFGTQRCYKSVVAAKVAATLGWAAVKQGDKVGGMIFTNDNLQETPARGRKQGILPLLNMLAGNHKAHSSKLKMTPRNEALARLRRVAKPGALIFIISDYYTWQADDEAIMQQMSRHCELVFCFITDPIEKTPPPPNRYAISNGKQTFTIDTRDQAFCRAYRQQFIHRREQLETLCRKLRMPLLEFSTTEPVNLLLGRFFIQKRTA